MNREKTIAWIDASIALEKIKSRPTKVGDSFVYSSYFGAWSKDSFVGLVPIDDHGFHRGDGVFEAIRLCGGKLYLIEEHLLRLQKSAEFIKLKLPNTINEIKKIIEVGSDVWTKEKSSNAMIRLYVTRGAGGFSTNPYECINSNLYIVITNFATISEEKYRSGVITGKSTVPQKADFMAKAKTLNYLPNVLMKAEALDQNLDFTFGFNDQGLLTESSTENIIIVDSKGVLSHPKLDIILQGCTMTRLFDLVEKEGSYPVNRQVQIKENDLLEAQAVMMVGTTLDVLPVASYEGKKYSDFTIAKHLRELIVRDQHH